jgi:catechol 2,3-dioxygenase
MQPEPLFDLAHFAHCELFTPKPNESLWFFTHVLSLQVVEQRGQSAYLRAYGDTPRATLKLTESPKPGLGHAAFRTISATALQRRVHALEAGGVNGRWIDGDFGHGAAYQFDDPDGHRFEIFYESEPHMPTDEDKPYLKNQAQRYPQSGARVRTLDHLNLLAAQVTPNKEFMREHLGFRLSEHIVLDDGTEAGAWLRVTSKSYDLVYTADALGAHNRLHHLAFRMDNREDVLRNRIAPV